MAKQRDKTNGPSTPGSTNPNVVADKVQSAVPPADDATQNELPGDKDNFEAKGIPRDPGLKNPDLNSPETPPDADVEGGPFDFGGLPNRNLKKNLGCG